MKVYISVLLVFGILLLSACSRKQDDNPAKSSQDQSPPTNPTAKVGISKIVAHPALDAVGQAIIETVQNSGKEVKFNIQNANGEISAANSIAQMFQNQQVDLAIGIATPTAQALVQNLSGIPIFYTAVTDPETTGLLSKRSTGMQITGYSDMIPIADHMTTIKRIQPDAQTIGQIYSSDEDNSLVLKELSEKEAAAQGMELISVTVTSTAEVLDAALSIVDEVDAFYITVDNKVISALAVLSQVADQNGVPLYTADPESAAVSGIKVIAAMGFDYSSMGKTTGELIVRYLNGDDSVFDIPIYYMDLAYQTIYIDQQQADKLGLRIPEDIQKLAAK